MTFKPKIDTVILMNVSDELREFYFKSITPYLTHKNRYWLHQLSIKPTTKFMIGGANSLVFEQTTLKRCPNLYPLIDETIKHHSL